MSTTYNLSIVNPFYFPLPVVIAVLGQLPGFIVRPSSGSGTATLNPHAERYIFATSLRFTTNDITQSEIPYDIIKPLLTSDPSGDLATGPSGGYSNIVKTVDGSGCYIFYDGINVLFRICIGGIVRGAKAYNVLIDTDLKLGATGDHMQIRMDKAAQVEIYDEQGKRMLRKQLHEGRPSNHRYPNVFPRNLLAVHRRNKGVFYKAIHKAIPTPEAIFKNIWFIMQTSLNLE